MELLLFVLSLIFIAAVIGLIAPSVFAFTGLTKRWEFGLLAVSICVLVGTFAPKPSVVANAGGRPQEVAALAKPEDPALRREHAERGKLFGVLDRYFAICQPWRGADDKVRVWDQAGFTPLLSDTPFNKGISLGHEFFDQMEAKSSGRQNICQVTYKFLTEAKGLTL